MTGNDIAKKNRGCCLWVIYYNVRIRFRLDLLINYHGAFIKKGIARVGNGLKTRFTQCRQAAETLESASLSVDVSGGHQCAARIALRCE